MTNENETIQLTIDGVRATITLNRPERHNALEQADLLAFITALEKVAADKTVRVLVISGRGEKTFCAGASLQQLMTGDFHSNVFETLTANLEGMSIPTICALNGSVYGGGAEIALCCDFRIGLHGTRLFVPPARLGLCYPLSGLQRFVTRLGMGSAKRILVSGETLPAEEMYRIGFLDYLVEQDEFEACQNELADRIAGLAPLAVQAMKRIINQIGRGAFDEEEAAALHQACLASQDLQEGFLAHSQKRDPVFQGR
jgi:enoyl-CoA hydratase/carnithine racemase